MRCRYVPMVAGEELSHAPLTASTKITQLIIWQSVFSTSGVPALAGKHTEARARWRKFMSSWTRRVALAKSTAAVNLASGDCWIPRARRRRPSLYPSTLGSSTGWWAQNVLDAYEALLTNGPAKAAARALPFHFVQIGADDIDDLDDLSNLPGIKHVWVYHRAGCRPCVGSARPVRRLRVR